MGFNSGWLCKIPLCIIPDLFQNFKTGLWFLNIDPDSENLGQGDTSGFAKP